MSHHDHHHHDHHHDHHHHHGLSSISAAQVNTAFTVGIILNLVFVVVELVIGFSIHSLSLLSDAGHNLADVGTLALSLLAYRLLKVKPNNRYTYGYRKTSVLVALINSLILVASIGAIIYEAILRLYHPQPLPGYTISIVAAVGIIINGLSALLFFKDKDHDLNIKSAYLHLLADAVISFGIVIGGLLIVFTDWYWIDPALSIIIALVILWSTQKLLFDSLRLSLDGVPEGVDIPEIKSLALQIDGIKDIHHVHVWAISTTENALTGHIVLENAELITINIVKEKLRHKLLHLNIHHITLETESVGEVCQNCYQD